MSTQPFVRSPNRQPRVRSVLRRERLAKGIQHAHRMRVWNVRPSALPQIPECLLERAVVGVVALPGSVWLRPVDARMLTKLDWFAGGWSEVTKTSYTRCHICNRPLMTLEGEERREAVLGGPDVGDTLPCGPNCSIDRDLKLWMPDLKKAA